MTVFVCGCTRSTIYLGTVALLHPSLLHCLIRQPATVSCLLLCNLSLYQELNFLTVSTTENDSHTGGNGSGDDDDELHGDEDEGEMLRMTDALTRIMV
jgi:hypothetical protein